MKIKLFSKRCFFVSLVLTMLFALLFSTINSIKINLTDSQSYTYKLELFPKVKSDELNISQKLIIKKISFYAINERKILSKEVNISTRAQDIYSPAKSFIVSVRAMSNNGTSTKNIVDLVIISTILSFCIILLLYNVLNGNTQRSILFLMRVLNKVENYLDHKFNKIMLFNWLYNKNWFYVVLLIFVFSRVILYVDYMVIKQFYGVTTGFVDSFCQWDCGWYSGLIAGGYDYAVHPVVVGSITKDQANWAFFPLFPLLIKGLNIFIHNALLNAIVFNQILLLLSSYLLFLYIVKEYGKSVALFGVALLLFATENIYFMSTYTESLFLFLSLLVLLLLKSKNFLAAAIVVGLLSATRFIGFLFFIPVLFSYLKTRRANFKIKDLSYCFLLIIICSSGLILYMIYLHFHVNDSLAFYHIQSAWGRNDSSWLSHPLNSLSLIFKSGYPYDRVLFYISLVMFFLAVKHKLWLELQLLLITVLPEIASKSLISYSRFMLINVAVYTVHN